MELLALLGMFAVASAPLGWLYVTGMIELDAALKSSNRTIIAVSIPIDND